MCRVVLCVKVLLDERAASLAMGPDFCCPWRRTADCHVRAEGTYQRGLTVIDSDASRLNYLGTLVYEYFGTNLANRTKQ
eukprot:6212777-Pleurochrysis_carterae.AAC.4